MALGFGPIFILTTDIIVSAAPPERAGSAGALSETGAEFGGVLGIAVLGSIGIAVYRGIMAHAVPEGVPVEAADAARDTLAGALAVAAELPEQLGAGLASTARDAFGQGFELVTIIAALLTVALAVLVLRALRNAGTGDATQEGTVN